MAFDLGCTFESLGSWRNTEAWVPLGQGVTLGDSDVQPGLEPLGLTPTFSLCLLAPSHCPSGLLTPPLHCAPGQPPPFSWAFMESFPWTRTFPTNR